MSALQQYSPRQLKELLQHLDPEERRQLADALEEKQHDGEVELCREWVVSHKRGPMYWLRNLTKTENYHWREQRLDPTMPFPYKPWEGRLVDLKDLPFEHDFTADDPPDYLDVVMGYLLTKKFLWVPKTREMMTSWLVVGFITWFCQFFEKIEWASQSEDDNKAQGLIKYGNILYTNQPEWLRKRFSLLRGDEGTLHKIEWANGSSFIAMPSGERKLASRHPYGYFLDEAAHIPAAEATTNIAMPAVRQIVEVSSVAPGWFADTCGC